DPDRHRRAAHRGDPLRRRERRAHEVGDDVAAEKDKKNKPKRPAKTRLPLHVQQRRTFSRNWLAQFVKILSLSISFPLRSQLSSATLQQAVYVGTHGVYQVFPDCSHLPDRSRQTSLPRSRGEGRG